MYKLLPLIVVVWACESASVKLDTERDSVTPQTENDPSDPPESDEEDPSDEEEENDSDEEAVDSLDEMIEQLEEDCENGDGRACGLLQELLALEEECERGNAEACEMLERMVEMFENGPDEPNPDDWGDESWEEQEWIPGVYEATLEVYRNNGMVMCSSTMEVTITSSEMIGESTCTTQMGHNFSFALTAQLSSTDSSGTVVVTAPRGVETEAEALGVCYNADGAVAFEVSWVAEMETPNGQQIEQRGMLYYLE